ncbi:2Fe-2S iron-sulfur cluster-binding protein [Thauera sp.]|uniref:2Fe-2S iron-sulfur cluster-binding protein n=1 Tax=Thauera sp. TaxID=1905334 RepID=UPI0039E4FE33
MLILIDGEWCARVLQCNGLHELLIVTPHHRRHLPKMRAAMDGVSRAWELNSAEIDQKWLLAAVGAGKTDSWREGFGALVARLWARGQVDEADGFIRVPVRWGIDVSSLKPGNARKKPDCHRIRIEDTGQEFSCLSESSVLHGCVFAGHGVLPSGCHGGGCGICRIKVVQGRYACGQMSRQHVSDEDIAQGIVLACRIYPLSDLVFELAGKAASRVKDTNTTRVQSPRREQ